MISIDMLVDDTSGSGQFDLDRWIENDWICADSTLESLRFQEIDVARIRLIENLRDSLAIGEESLPVVLPVLDQVYDLHRFLQSLGPAQNPPGREPLSPDIPSGQPPNSQPEGAVGRRPETF